MRLYGPVGHAFVDVWTLVHFAFWFIVGADVESQGWSHYVCFPLAFVGAYLWEVVETGIEREWWSSIPVLGKLKVEKHEGPLNRWVSDPLFCIIGYWLGAFAISLWG